MQWSTPCGSLHCACMAGDRQTLLTCMLRVPVPLIPTKQVIEDDITVEQFSGAMTNMVYRCGLLQGGKEVQVRLLVALKGGCKGATASTAVSRHSSHSCCCVEHPTPPSECVYMLPQVVLMRVHASSSELFDRQVEIQTFQAVSQAGLGPQLLLLFRNGRVEEFLSEHVSCCSQSGRDRNNQQQQCQLSVPSTHSGPVIMSSPVLRVVWVLQQAGAGPKECDALGTGDWPNHSCCSCAGLLLVLLLCR